MENHRKGSELLLHFIGSFKKTLYQGRISNICKSRKSSKVTPIYLSPSSESHQNMTFLSYTAFIYWNQWIIPKFSSLKQHARAVSFSGIRSVHWADLGLLALSSSQGCGHLKILLGRSHFLAYISGCWQHSAPPELLSRDCPLSLSVWATL
jgi:hypothetical protein